MRCLLFTDTINDVNGVARFLRSLAGWAHGLEKELLVLSSTVKAEPIDAPVCAGIEILPPILRFCLPRYPDLDLALPPLGGLRMRARRFRPNVIHVSTPGPVGLCGCMIARELGVPLVATWHTDFAAYVERLTGLPSLGEIAVDLLRMFYADFEMVLARSPVSLPDIRSAGVRRALAFSPGIDLRKFSPVWKDREIWQQWGLEPARKKVVYVGRVSVEKGMVMLANVFERLEASKVAADLVIVGDGPFRGHMQRRLPAAVFTGFLHGENLSRVFASSDLVLFPSETDTLGQVALEAQASGVPVIVSDRGGPRHLVSDGVTGFVIPAADEEAWCVRVEALLCEPMRLKELGEQAQRWMQNFDIDSSCAAFWQAHEDLLNQLRASRA